MNCKWCDEHIWKTVEGYEDDSVEMGHMTMKPHEWRLLCTVSPNDLYLPDKEIIVKRILRDHESTSI